MGEPTNHGPAGTHVGPGAADRLSSLEAQFVMFRQTYFRELVNEGRLDWDGFDLEADAGDLESEDFPATIGPLLSPAGGADSRRRRWGRAWRG